MEIKRKTIQNQRISYLGALESLKKRVFISSSFNVSDDVLDSCYSSAFEAARSGYNIIAIPFSKCADAIEAGAIDGKSSISYVFPCGLKRVKRQYINKTLITSGTAISAEEDDEAISYVNVLKAKSIAAYFSDIVISGDISAKTKRDALHLVSALDEGRDVAILRSALSSKILRELVAEGAPVINTFSDFLIEPKCYLYPRRDGFYGFGERKFGIIKINE